jgi:transposase
VGQRLELVPDGLGRIVEPLIPPQRERPQGGGTRYVEDRAVFTAIVYVLTTGCAWRHLPAEFGVSRATAHRRFVAWTEAGLWRRLHRAALDRLGQRAAIDWSRGPAWTRSASARKDDMGRDPLSSAHRGCVSCCGA